MRSEERNDSHSFSLHQNTTKVDHASSFLLSLPLFQLFDQFIRLFSGFKLRLNQKISKMSKLCSQLSEYTSSDFRFCEALMLDYLPGMHYLHAEAPVKVIHRDLKSRNGLFLPSTPTI